MSDTSARADVNLYQQLLKPGLFRLPAELAHELASLALRVLAGAARFAPGVRGFGKPDAAAKVEVMGLDFASPIVMAAGFDKYARLYEGLFALGFGGVEVGTITHEAQAGNPRPRLFRLPADRALLNRMGFNNCGAAAASRRLRGPRSGVVGVNIGKTKRVPEAEALADYVRGAELLGPLADYVVVNVSSPNTPGLRDLQAVEKLGPLLRAVREALERVCPTRQPPLLVKIAPDLNDAEIVAVAELALELGLAGIVATNTTIARSGLETPAAELEGLGAGGISGAPLKARALDVLRLLRQRVGPKLTLVAAGGIETVDDAWQRLLAGANLLQVYTALIYEGPGLPSRLAHGLVERARNEGFESLGALASTARTRATNGAQAPAASSIRT